MPTTSEPTTAGQIRAARLALGLSQEQLARRLNVSFATVNRWERGRTRPGEAMLPAVAAVLSLAAGSGAAGADSGEGHVPPPETQRAIDWLAIFPATFSLDAAELVAGSRDGGGSTLVELGSLVASGQIEARRTPAGARYRLTDEVRSAALVRLAARGDRQEASRRLLAWCTRVAAEVGAGMRGPEQAHWLALAGLEADAVAASIEFAAANGDAARAVALAGGFWRYWYSTAEHAEGRRLLALALGTRGRAGDADRAQALLGSGVIARHQGDVQAAIRFFHAHLERARLVGDDRSIAQAHNSLAGALHQSGQVGRARKLLLDSLEWWERTRDRQGMAAALSNLGVVASDTGELEAAREFGEQALALRLALGNAEDIAISYENLATVALRAGDDGEARRLFRETLRRYVALDELDGVANALDGLALLAGGDVARALLRVSDRILERTGAQRTGDTAARVAARRASLSATGADVPGRHAPAGSDETAGSGVADLEVAAAVELALAASGEDDPGPAARHLQRRLTPRERQVLSLVTDGWTSKEIAARIGRSPRTVEHHLANVYAKVGARGRADAIAFGVRMGLGEQAT